MEGNCSKIVVYYDGWCPICVSISKSIQRMDIFKRVELISIREPGIERHGIPLSLLEKHMHARFTQSGRIVSGISACLAICRYIPLFMPFWPLLKLSQLIGIGERMYDFIARNRIIVPVGNCGENGCEIRRK